MITITTATSCSLDTLMVSGQSVYVTLAAGTQLSLQGSLPAQGALHITLEQGSSLTVSVLALQATTCSITMRLAGEHAQARLRCAIMVHAEDVVQVNTIQEHAAAQTMSSVISYALIGDQASVRCEGLITIEETAPLSNALLTNKNFLLSDQARAISIPSLQVLTNEVQCKHGSATGYLDEQLLWMLQARGLSHMQAKRLLVTAFMQDMLKDVADDTYRAIVEEKSMALVDGSILQ